MLRGGEDTLQVVPERADTHGGVPQDDIIYSVLVDLALPEIQAPLLSVRAQNTERREGACL